MRISLPVILGVVAQFAGGCTASSLSTAELATLLPSCALNCLVTSVLNSTCELTDPACICTNVPLIDTITKCVLEGCTIKEALTAQNLTATSCDHPVRDERKYYSVLTIALSCISWTAGILRFLARYLSDSDFGYDDWTILLVLVIGLPSTVINIQGLTTNGLGKDIWTLPFKNITDLLHVFLVAQVLYFIEVALVKISILFFYLRIFPGTTFRKVVYGTLIFTGLTSTVFVLATIFQCSPINYQWKQWDGEHEGKCIDNNALAFSNGGINIVLDVWVLVLPLLQILRLNLHWKKKLGVTLMFCVGAFVTVVSIIRIPKISTLSKSQNPSWDYIPVGTWSTIEINAAIICACMPTLRILLLRTFPKFMGSTRTDTKPSGSISAENPGAYGTASSRDKSGITWTKSFNVGYSCRQPGDSDVELVDAEHGSLKTWSATRS